MADLTGLGVGGFWGPYLAADEAYQDVQKKRYANQQDQEGDILFQQSVPGILQSLGPGGLAALGSRGFGGAPPGAPPPMSPGPPQPPPGPGDPQLGFNYRPPTQPNGFQPGPPMQAGQGPPMFGNSNFPPVPGGGAPGSQPGGPAPTPIALQRFAPPPQQQMPPPPPQQAAGAAPPGAQQPPPGSQQPQAMPQGLDWRVILQKTMEANPHASPAAYAAAVSRWLPLMNSQAQMEWKQVQMQLQTERLNDAQERLRMERELRASQGFTGPGGSMEPDESLAQKIAKYEQAPLNPSRTAPQNKFTMDRVYQINPDYDVNQYWKLHSQSTTEGRAAATAEPDEDRAQKIAKLELPPVLGSNPKDRATMDRVVQIKPDYNIDDYYKGKTSAQTTGRADAPVTVDEDRAQKIAKLELPPMLGTDPVSRATMKRVEAINPGYNATDYNKERSAATTTGRMEAMTTPPPGQKATPESKLMTEKAFSPQGPNGKIVTAMNNVVGHLSLLRGVATALDNREPKAINAAKNYFEENWAGQTAPASFNAVRDIVGDELVKAIVGGGGVFDRAEVQERLSRALNFKQINDVINHYMGLAERQLQSQRQTYKANSERDDFDERYLMKDTVEAMQKASRDLDSGAGGGPKVLRYDAQGNLIKD